MYTIYSKLPTALMWRLRHESRFLAAGSANAHSAACAGWIQFTTGETSLAGAPEFRDATILRSALRIRRMFSLPRTPLTAERASAYFPNEWLAAYWSISCTGGAGQHPWHGAMGLLRSWSGHNCSSDERHRPADCRVRLTVGDRFRALRTGGVNQRSGPAAGAPWSLRG